MSEFHAASANAAMTPAAVVAKPRISADAFRNLTARLKKPDVVVPDLAPAVAAPAPAPVVVAEPAIPEIMMVEELRVAPLPPVPEFVPPPLQPIPEFVPPAPQVELAPVPVFAEPALEIMPLPEPQAVAPLPEPQVVALAAEPALEGSFAENFTLVPEPGKAEEVTVEAKPDLAAIDEAVKREVAERAIQLELENIWRLLLAKPTAEDRSIYLKEAAQIHADDEEWNKPAPEFDLSNIEPAAPVESLPIAEQAVEAVVADDVDKSIPVPEGQDLAELTRSLLDMMAAGNQSGLPHERALAADTLLRLVPRLELKPLVMLSQRLAMMDNPPHLLVARLIRDERVEVSGPILEDCSSISDKDLESVVQEGKPDKLRMVARRRKLSRANSDSLIKSGDPSVVLTLVRNMEAEISHDGFQSLLLLAENNEELLAPLATRQDLGAPFAFELFWHSPSQLRRFILSRFLTDSETLTKILKITMATKEEEDGEAEPLSQHALLEALERAARGRIDIAAEELAGIMKLSQSTIARILGDLEGDALVVMLKAAGYPRSAVTGLLKRMQDAELPLVTRERDISELQTLFETLSFNKARILVTYWDWAQSKTGPYAPVQ